MDVALSHTAYLIHAPMPGDAPEPPPRPSVPSVPWPEYLGKRGRVHYVRRQWGVERGKQWYGQDVHVLVALYHAGDALPAANEWKECTVEPCECLCGRKTGGCGLLLPLTTWERTRHAACHGARILLAKRTRRKRGRREHAQPA